MQTMYKKKRQLSNDIENATLYINAYANNTIVTCADVKGNVLAWSSSGERGFKGARKASPFAAQVTVETVIKKIGIFNIKNFEVEVRGASANRDAAIRSLQSFKLTVLSIRDITPVSHNGCRPPKARRV
ncbi:30S ribosomal protein S11 [Candidatus Hodgkinia cicadicola]|nr:30S ribosomal protein S11 [Candidatus Hodgkinia cicadicola]